ncbi:DivIVA domain-containing protein [Micromonospora palomenae]|uniref:DivIVA domain-containing protein n=1 Tax=Micromonospora palomenae TaxID=1461247 RepID=UPI003F89CF96
MGRPALRHRPAARSVTTAGGPAAGGWRHRTGAAPRPGRAGRRVLGRPPADPGRRRAHRRRPWHDYLNRVADELERLHRELTTANTEAERIRQALRQWQSRHTACRHTDSGSPNSRWQR